MPYYCKAKKKVLSKAAIAIDGCLEKSAPSHNVAERPVVRNCPALVWVEDEKDIPR